MKPQQISARHFFDAFWVLINTALLYREGLISHLQFTHFIDFNSLITHVITMAPSLPSWDSLCELLMIYYWKGRFLLSAPAISAWLNIIYYQGFSILPLLFDTQYLHTYCLHYWHFNNRHCLSLIYLLIIKAGFTIEWEVITKDITTFSPLLEQYYCHSYQYYIVTLSFQGQYCMPHSRWIISSMGLSLFRKPPTLRLLLFCAGYAR